ncbi:MAG TPA: GvpL/GvpF family gas vesicle protein [Solirubrobacteraceae bacterium]
MSAGLRGSRGISTSRLSVRPRRGRRGVAKLAPIYVYGIVPAGAPVPDDLHGIGDAQVHVFAHGSIAAVTSRLPSSRPLGTAADLRAHARVIERIYQSCPVLPMRFGGALADPHAVAAELLEPNSDMFAGALERIDNHEQFTLRGRYRDGAALREVLAEQPKVARMSAWLRERDADTYRLEAIQLGTLVARALEQKQQADMAVMREILEPRVTAIAERVIASPDIAVDAAFLVQRPDRSAFEQAAEELGRRWESRIRLRLVGPLPAYDFTQTPEMEQWAC